MFDERSLKRDLLALGLLAAVVFLGTALATYDPADPPGTLVYPPHARLANACGRSGALAAHWLLEGLGVGAYYLVVSLAALDFLLLARRPIGDLALRSAGWLISLAGICTFAALALAGFSPGPVIGAGGYLGATGRGLLEMNFAAAGSYILTLSATFGGLLLCTDYVLVRLALRLLGLSAGPILYAGRAAAARSARSAAGTVLAAEPGPAIRIRGKASASDADDDDASTPLPVKKPAAVAAKPAPSAPLAAVAAAVAPPPSPPTPDKPVEEAAPPVRIKVPGKRAEHEAVRHQLDAAAEPREETNYQLPPIDMLLEGEQVSFEQHEAEVRRKAKILEKTFANFGFDVRVVEIETGPVIAQFEVELAAGLKLSKITALSDDLAIALRVPSVRIVAPIPGKNTVGIEVPNSERHIVRLREVIEEGVTRSQKMRIPIFLGKDVSGKPMIVDLSTLPHLLIAGRTGTGKSVCLNSIIVSMIMSRRPDEVRMLMIDPKMVELSPYKTLPHLMHPVVTDMRKAEAILAWAVEKMEERYALLARAGVRHIASYNQLGEEELMDRLQPENDEERQSIPTSLPYIVIVADEIADLMMTAPKEVEQHIIRLAQKSRAVGIHLVLATQKPTVDVITGLIKSNLPARIAFQVASRTDSRVVLDEMGADKLLGNGDLLFLWPGTSTLLRGQGTYVSDEEINGVVDFVGTDEQNFVAELVQLKPADAAGAPGAAKLPARDDLYEAAVDLVIREGRGSVSLLQRSLGIGYGRAARLIDFMAEDGIVGAYNGSQAREVLISLERWAELSGQASAPAPVPPRSGRTISLVPPARPAAKQPGDELAEEEVDEAPWDDEEDDYEDDRGDDEADGEEDELDEDRPTDDTPPPRRAPGPFRSRSA